MIENFLCLNVDSTQIDVFFADLVVCVGRNLDYCHASIHGSVSERFN